MNWLATLDHNLFKKSEFFLLMFKIDKRDETYSPRMMVAGVILLFIRLRSYIEWRTEDGFFDPETSHISYFLSFISCFALICSFRQPALNSAPFLLFPSYFITLPGWDLPWIIKGINGEITTWQFINAMTIHIPCLLMGIWIFINRRELISWESVKAAACFGLPYFFMVDNKTNDVGINGWAYTILVIGVAFIWLYVIKKKVLRETNMENPWLAHFVGLKWVPRNQKEEPLEQTIQTNSDR